MPAQTPLIQHIYTADPSVIVEDERLYLFTGHDEPPPGVDAYVMNDWKCFSTTNLKDWNEHPTPLEALDFAWSSGDAFASKVIFYDNKYYWFVSTTEKATQKKAIGLAVSDNIVGPYKDALGAPLVTHAMLPAAKDDKANLDPTVFVDSHGQAHLFWGNGMCYYATLSKDLRSLAGSITIVDLPEFSEGAHIHSHQGWYYLCYGAGLPEQILCSRSSSITGPWVSDGIICGPASNSETNRPAIITFQQTHLFFYHNGALEGGGSHRRSVCVQELNYDTNGRIEKMKMN